MEQSNRGDWPAPNDRQTRRTDWKGDDYQARFDSLASTGVDMHGEATFVRGFHPSSVLDAGCGTGRVAIELARHGIDVVGVDVEPSMLGVAEGVAPHLAWVEADLTAFDLQRQFDAVILAGNVPLFTPAGTQSKMIECCARHVAPGGILVLGFSLGRGYGLDELDSNATAAGLELVDRFATWDAEPFDPARSNYAVSVFRPRSE